MNHQDHVNLLRGGIPAQGGIWADFGSGTGAFTLALADLIGADAHIYSIDQDAYALKQQAQAMQRQFPDIPVQYQRADFTQTLELPPLDGIVMANALHFYREKQPILAQLQTYLKPGGVFLLVEYDVDMGNQWVPYPLSYNTWATVSHKNGFIETRLLHRVPTRFLKAIYAASSLKP